MLALKQAGHFNHQSLRVCAPLVADKESIADLCAFAERQQRLWQQLLVLPRWRLLLQPMARRRPGMPPLRRSNGGDGEGVDGSGGGASSSSNNNANAAAVMANGGSGTGAASAKVVMTVQEGMEKLMEIAGMSTLSPAEIVSKFEYNERLAENLRETQKQTEARVTQLRAEHETMLIELEEINLGNAGGGGGGKSKGGGGESAGGDDATAKDAAASGDGDDDDASTFGSSLAGMQREVRRIDAEIFKAEMRLNQAMRRSQSGGRLIQDVKAAVQHMARMMSQYSQRFEALGIAPASAGIDIDGDGQMGSKALEVSEIGRASCRERV